MKHSLLSLAIAAIATLALTGCAAIEVGGRMVSGVGNSLADWGDKNDSSLVKTGGKLYQDIGSGIQSAARSDASQAEAAKKEAPKKE